MASTLTQLLVHITFSTKDREDVIPVGVEPDLYAYVGGICRRLESPLLAMNGTGDHVHMFIGLNKNIALAGLMMEVKRDSSKWLKAKGLTRFQWQNGYFGFSIGESGAAALRRYVAGQKAHHKAVDFKDEVRILLRKYKMTWDERYIWD